MGSLILYFLDPDHFKSQFWKLSTAYVNSCLIISLKFPMSEHFLRTDKMKNNSNMKNNPNLRKSHSLSSFSTAIPTVHSLHLNLRLIV